MFNLKIFLAEFIGTFALVFVGASAGITGVGLVAVALAHGLTLAVFAYAYGHISGTHVNPAVTFALALNGTIKWGQALVYWIAQFAGSILAAYLLFYMVTSTGREFTGADTTGVLMAVNDPHPIIAMIVEALLTFFLVNTILHTAVAGKGGVMAPWAIGTTLMIAILGGGAFTGASLNPARTLGPAFFGGANSLTDANTYVIYLFGPLIGATLAAIAYNFFMGTDEAAEVVEEVVVAEVVEVVKPVKAVKAVRPARKVTRK